MIERNKTIFISSFHSFVSKNILNTDILNILKETGHKIFILVPSHKVDFFRETYADNNVDIIGLSGKYLNRGRVKFFFRLSMLMIDSHYLWYKKRERFDSGSGFYAALKYFFETLATKILKHLRFIDPVIRNAFIKYVRIDEIRECFEKYSPSHVFVTDIFDETDILIAAEAKRQEVGITGMVRSWDNCYSKGLMRVIPDKLIVNNSTIANEASEIHGVNKADIVVLGSPQYDAFINKPRSSRESFCRELGLNPMYPYILFAPAGKILSDTDDQIIEMILAARKTNRVPSTLQVLVRNHPGHPADLSRFEGIDGVFIDNPGRRFDTNNPKDSELTEKDNDKLADTLYHAQVVLWVATTLGMDAIVFDKPQIVINFDGYKNKPYPQSVRKYHNEDHMKKMLELGGITTVNGENDLIEAINSYVGNPEWNSEGRERVRKQQFYKLDGKAGKRIGDFLVSELSKD